MMEYYKKIFFKYLLIYIFFIIFNSKGNFLLLVLPFDGSVAGSSPAAFLLASRIIEP